MSSTRVSITKDELQKLVGAVTTLGGKQVLVGIPEAETAREDGPVTNAALGYIHEFGSPAANIPARPFLIPGVKRAEDAEVEQLRMAAAAALDGDSAKADQRMNAAGLIASSSAKAEINSNIPPPLSPETIRRRKYSRGTASRRDSENDYLEMVDEGESPEYAQSSAGIIALVNTGQLRNSLTYVLRKK